MYYSYDDWKVIQTIFANVLINNYIYNYNYEKSF